MKIYIIGFIVISFLGTIFHFTYELSKHNKIVSIFSAVNESTWEHIKIALSASFFYMIIELIFLSGFNGFYFAKLVSLLSIIVLIPSIFYSYQLIAKKPILFIDISSFYITIFLSQLFGFLIITKLTIPPLLNSISLILIIIIFIFYLLATIFPLKNLFFIDPITHKYGYKGHFEEKK